MTAYVTAAQLRALLDGTDELAVLDVRSPQARTTGHLALSSGVPLHDLEQRIGTAVPRLATPIVLASDPDLDERAARLLTAIGYRDVSVLLDGLAGWTAAGGRLYTGTHNRSKTLGEWIEKRFGTATIDAATVAQWRDAGEDFVILDSRPHSEYLHHHIPGGYDTGGGAELAYRGLAVVDRPTTKIVVNCAGRTRGIVGAQSVINTGIANPVYSLHNGTPAWGWAGERIEHGAGDRAPAPAVIPAERLAWAQRTLDDAGVTVLDADRLPELTSDTAQTTYLIDVRTPEEHAAATYPGARNVQGGQLVQATDEHLAVRRARIVLVDDADLVRAASTVQWLRYLHDGPLAVVVTDPRRTSAPTTSGVPVPDVPLITPADLADELDSVLVFDLRSSAAYEAGHLPGSVHARREHLPHTATTADSLVLVGESPQSGPTGAADLQAAAVGYLPHFAARDLADQGYRVRVLAGSPGDVGVPLTTDDPRHTGEIADRTGPPPFGPARDAWYREYFDWEYALVPNSADDPDFDFDAYLDPAAQP